MLRFSLVEMRMDMIRTNTSEGKFMLGVLEIFWTLCEEVIVMMLVKDGKIGASRIGRPKRSFMDVAKEVNSLLKDNEKAANGQM